MCAPNYLGCKPAAEEYLRLLLIVVSLAGVLLVGASILLLGLTIREQRIYISALRR